MNREKNKKKDLPLTISRIIYVSLIILLAIAVMWPEKTDGSSPIDSDTIEIQEEPVPSEIQETTTTITTTTKKRTTTKKKVVTTKKAIKKVNNNYRNGFTAFITHYGPNCKGCSGITASGYNVKNTIYYNDKEYGKVRIVATSRNIPLYTIIRISNYKKGSITAIVLDRGVSGNKIDVLVESEKAATKLGIQKNAKVEILRWGK